MEQYPIGCLLKMITDKIKIQADANLAQHDLTPVSYTHLTLPTKA